MTPKSLQNKSAWEVDKPTICITVKSSKWEAAYAAWLDDKNPTDSPEWKKGVYLTFQSEG